MSTPSHEIPADDAFFDFKCPYCGEVNSFPTSLVHTLQECASCQEPVIAPEAGVETGGKLPLPISTQRLLLRRFRHDDSVKLLEVAAQDESGALPLITETTADEWIEQQRAALFTRGDAGVYLAIEALEGHDLAGFVQLAFMDRDRTGVGFTLAIHPPLRRQGLGLEAALAAIDFAFGSLCARRISVHCASQDAAACRLLEKAGLRKEGEFVKSRFDGKEWINISYYALLKDERPSSSS